MGVLEQITQMKKEGVDDTKIVNRLQEQGISPKEINDAISQSQIKSAVSNEEPTPITESPPPQEEYIPQTQETQPQENYPQQQYQEYYPQETTPAYQTGDNTIEIAEQVFQEKIKTIQNTVNKLNEFQTLTQTQLENISDRLKRIETSFDKMQLSILDKVGNYGKNIDTLKKEVSMIEDSFGKLSTTHTLKHTKTPTKKKYKKKTHRKKK